MGLNLLDYLSIFLQKAKLNSIDGSRWNQHEIEKTKPLLYYGRETLPGLADTASGGIIKCMDLARIFANTPYNSNILYLVSSALPINVQFLINKAKRAGVKIVVNQNGVAYPAWHGKGWQKTNLPLRAVLHAADYVIYQSVFCKQMSNQYLGQIHSPSAILHNPVDTEYFSPQKKGSPTHTLLVAGTHNHGYRIRIVLETLALLKRVSQLPFRLCIAGPLRWHRDQDRAGREVASWCKELEVESYVRLIGPYSQNRAVEMFCDADMLLHVQYNDVCPRLLVEVMACGLPVVYSRSGGSPELVGETAGVGIDVPADFEKEHYPSPEKMAEGVMTVYSDLSTFQAAARRRAVDNFDVRTWIKRHEQIFSDVLQ